MFNVNANLFSIAAGFVSKEETRYYLQGVHIERHAVRGAIMAATDGHRAIAIHDENAVLARDFQPQIVRLSKDALKACKAGRGEDDRHLVANDLSSPLHITREGEAVAIAPDWRVDGTFPDWRRIVPSLHFEPGETLAFDTAYVNDFGNAAKALTRRRDAFAAFTGRGDGPLLVNLGVNHAFGVLMPIRWKDSLGVPAWLNAAPVGETEAA